MVYIYLEFLHLSDTFVKATQFIKFITIYLTIMKTLLNTNQPHEEILCTLIADFFDCRKLSAHLIFLDRWMEMAFTNQRYKKSLHPSNLLFFATKFLNLLAACHEVHQVAPEKIFPFEEKIKIHESLILSYPYYLRTKEICNPIVVFHSIFKNHTLEFYQNALQNWSNSTEIGNLEEKAKLILPTYKNLKRMMEACWLIHERLNNQTSTVNFSLSCPLLLKDEYLTNPYLMIESFFSFASVEEYKQDLTHWFKVALNDQLTYENASDLLFIHNQFTQLIHAGYLIGTSKLVYKPSTNYTKQHPTFGHWLLARTENHTIHTLPPHFRENLIEFCSEILTLPHVTKLRYGLKEWLEAALSQNNSITTLDPPYIFDQYEDLQKIVEASFLLITQPTSTFTN